MDRGGSDALLCVKSVSKQFSSVRAVDDLSFDVRAGEIFALLGPNGAGKTTMVRMTVDIFRADSGSVEFSAEVRDGDGGSRADARYLGYLPEERGLHRDMSVVKTLEYFGALRGMDRSEAREAALAGLARFGLVGREKDRIDALSKGNQQKVQFLAAVLHWPRFVVLDEPFSGLDPLNQQRFLDEIRGLRDGGCTVLLSAHQMDLVESVADRLLVLDEGRAVLAGSLDEIRRETGSGTRIELGVSRDAHVDGLGALGGVSRVDRPARDRVTLLLERGVAVGEVLAAVTREVEVVSVHSAPESLREIFIRTVGRSDVDGDEAATDARVTEDET
jgi:ABC-2 type transport system ATP-binding protein